MLTAKYVGTSRYFADAVQFELTDVNGNEVTGQDFGAETYTLSITKPDGSKLVAKDLSLVWDKANGVYTLKYTDKTTLVSPRTLSLASTL